MVCLAWWKIFGRIFLFRPSTFLKTYIPTRYKQDYDRQLLPSLPGLYYSSLSAPLCIIPFFSFSILLLEILLFIYARELLLVDTHNLSGTSLSWCPSRRRGLCKSSRGEVTTLNATKKKEEKREKESPHLAHFIEPVKMHFFTLVASLNVPVGGVIVCVLSARWNFLILAGSYRLMRNSCTGDNATDSSDLSLCVSAHTL